MNSSGFARAGLILLALFGAWSAASVSYEHFAGVETCPKLGPVLACYVVLIGYAAIILAGSVNNKTLFIIGWIPVFALAALGVSAELLSASAVCPQTENGVPKCYISFGVAALIGVLSRFSVFRVTTTSDE